MTKPILLLQFRTDVSLKHEVDCVQEKVDGFRVVPVNVLDPSTKIPTPEDLSHYSAVISGGSGQYDITSLPENVEKRINKLKPLFIEIVNTDFPALMICFSHQLLCHFLGYVVKADSNQSEVGTHSVKINNEGKKSAIFQNIPEEFNVVMGHKDSVMGIPEGATLLASSDRCGVQSLRLGNNVYTTQFHPELNRNDLVYRLGLYPTYMKGKTVEEVKRSFRPLPHANKIVKNFVRMI